MNGESVSKEGLDRQIERLTIALDRNEQRLKRTERQLRFFGLSAISAMALWLFAGPHAGTPVHAEGVIERVEHKVEQDIAALEKKSEQDFRALMARVKKDLASAERADPAHMVAVILHDVKDALEAVPHMAEDMQSMAHDMRQMNAKMSAVPAMAGEMQQMNLKMGVMTYGVDSTMGRMGRWMPWGP